MQFFERTRKQRRQRHEELLRLKFDEQLETPSGNQVTYEAEREELSQRQQRLLELNESLRRKQEAS